MAVVKQYANVGGATSGARNTIKWPVYQSGYRWYVSSITGSDAASPRGRERERPLATLSQALTNASAYDTIVCLAGHVETLTSALAFNKAGLKVYGEGNATTRPSFTCNGAIAMFDVTVAECMFENLYFPQSGTAPTARIRFAAVGGALVNCYFDCGANDTAAAVRYITSCGQELVQDCTFRSTGTALTAQPFGGIEVANAFTGFKVWNTTFDGGSVGWSDFALKCTAAVSGFHGVDIDLLNNSDIFFEATSTTETHVRSATGSARIEGP